MTDYGHIIPARNEPFIVQANGTRGTKINLGSMLEVQQGERLWQYKLPDGSILITRKRIH